MAFGHMCFGIDANITNLVCGGHGNCSSTDFCDCESENYFGINCNVTTCFGIRSNSSEVCNGHGLCEDYNTCKCNNYSYGNECEDPLCGAIPESDESNCYYHGKCKFGENANGTEIAYCSCIKHFNGNHCRYKDTHYFVVEIIEYVGLGYLGLLLFFAFIFVASSYVRDKYIEYQKKKKRKRRRKPRKTRQKGKEIELKQQPRRKTITEDEFKTIKETQKKQQEILASTKIKKDQKSKLKGEQSMNDSLKLDDSLDDVIVTIKELIK